MALTLVEAKKQLRKFIQARLERMSKKETLEETVAVINRVVDLPEWKEAKNVSIFLSIDHEVVTDKLIESAFKSGKNVFVPLIVGKTYSDMVMMHAKDQADIDNFPRNKWGIPEPPASYEDGTPRKIGKDFDLVIVPGVAFNSLCQRCGHGKGYYDYFIRSTRSRDEKKSTEVKKKFIALSLSCQILDEALPFGEFDAVVDAVVTPFSVFTPSDEQVVII